MNIKKKEFDYYAIGITILAIVIVIGVLFIKPQVGVADQGDFDRLMGISGLSLLDSDTNNPNFVRFYNYIVPEYKIIDIDKIILTITGCSISYLIVFIRTICKMVGQTVFKTQYLAGIYCIIYIIGLNITLKSLDIRDNVKRIFVSLLALFIFFDGNYLIWFNSLYGEPMMITTFLLFVAFILNYIHYKYVFEKNEHVMSRIVFILLAAYLFLGSKLQVITSIPFILFLIIKIIWNNRAYLNKGRLVSLCILTYIVILYPVGISMESNCLSKDTEYNSVFYGVLKGSQTPKEDLKDLGLNQDMAVEGGKHSYLDSNEYVRYIPGTEITNEEFYSKISNLKLAKFYLTHPIRLFEGMEYTAGKAFLTSTSLGKCTQSYTETTVTEFNRFTCWSRFREKFLPKNLMFIFGVYLMITIFSVNKYVKNKSNLEMKNKIHLLWIIMLIGVVQFPMPFVGNGMADTAKQLFLFNFIFDCLLLLIISYVFFKVIDIFKAQSNK